ncbi:MAG: S-methyl-5'-thioinosine phosphorylase [Pseudomonadales bacterium]
MLAVIGGTGFGEFVGLESLEELNVATPWGPAQVDQGTFEGEKVLFLARHGKPAKFPPHEINYRANIFALGELGASGVLAINAVGGIARELELPELVFPDQIIDYTWGRPHTFFDEQIHHIDFTFPFDAGLREQLTTAAHAVDRPITFRTEGVYGCTQGPRLETAAEIRRMAQDGCHVVGMTGMPEATLAREIDVPYAGISVVVNKAAGLDGQVVDLGGIEQVLDQGMQWVRDILARLVKLP